MVPARCCCSCHSGPASPGRAPSSGGSAAGLPRARGRRRSAWASDLAERFPAARDVFEPWTRARRAALAAHVGGAGGRAHAHAERPARHPRATAAASAVAGPRLLDEVAAAAGHSLGEYSAYVAAGAFVRRRRGDAGAPPRASSCTRPGSPARRHGRGAGPRHRAGAARLRDASSDGSIAVRGQHQRARPDGHLGRSGRRSSARREAAGSSAPSASCRSR